MNLDPNFDCTKLVNLTELDLLIVRGINADKFIQFLRRPSLENFRNYTSFENSTAEKIFYTTGTYCGEKICQFVNNNNEVLENFSYKFISNFKNLKKAKLSAKHICCADVIDPIKRLAESNAIEYLGLIYYQKDSDNNENCIFQTKANYEGLDMNCFSNLKTI